jgi:hypothetical protein
VFFDALRVKIRDEGVVRNKAIYLALGVDAESCRNVLGLWIEQTEGAKFWLKVVNDLKNRGVEDTLIAVVDGLKGFPEAINATFPATTVQNCIVHLIRNSLAYVSWKDRKSVAAALQPVYTAPSAEAAQAADLMIALARLAHAGADSETWRARQRTVRVEHLLAAFRRYALDTCEERLAALLALEPSRAVGGPLAKPAEDLQRQLLRPADCRSFHADAGTGAARVSVLAQTRDIADVTHRALGALDLGVAERSWPRFREPRWNCFGAPLPRHCCLVQQQAHQGNRT